jgi:hypothetical protein
MKQVIINLALKIEATMPVENETIKKLGTRIILVDTIVELSNADIITTDQLREAANEINNIYP